MYSFFQETSRTLKIIGDWSVSGCEAPSGKCLFLEGKKTRCCTPYRIMEGPDQKRAPTLCVHGGFLCGVCFFSCPLFSAETSYPAGSDRLFDSWRVLCKFFFLFEAAVFCGTCTAIGFCRRYISKLCDDTKQKYFWAFNFE